MFVAHESVWREREYDGQGVSTILSARALAGELERSDGRARLRSPRGAKSDLRRRGPFLAGQSIGAYDRPHLDSSPILEQRASRGELRRLIETRRGHHKVTAHDMVLTEG